MSALNGYMTTCEASRVLKKSRSRIDQLCRNGTLRSVEVGNARLIDAASVKAYAKANRKQTRKSKGR